MRAAKLKMVMLAVGSVAVLGWGGVGVGAVATTASADGWSAVFRPTTGVAGPMGAPVTATVGSYFYGNPWNGTDVASYATRSVALGGLGITDGSAPAASDWLSVNYNGQGLGNANNGYLTFSKNLDVLGNAFDLVSYRFAFAGDNRVMNVRVVSGSEVIPLYTYEVPTSVPAQGSEFYKGYAMPVAVAPGAFSLTSSFTSLRLEVDLFNEQNLDSFGPHSPVGLIFAGKFENTGSSMSNIVPEPGAVGWLVLGALGVVRRLRS